MVIFNDMDKIQRLIYFSFNNGFIPYFGFCIDSGYIRKLSQSYNHFSKYSAFEQLTGIY